MIGKCNPTYFCNGDITKIENYDKAIADQTQVWEIHHRLETHFSDGTPRPIDAYLTKAELKALDMYYHRPPEEFIFLTKAGHRSLHHKGRVSPTKGMHQTESAKQKISEKMKKIVTWTKGRKWYNNGEVSVMDFSCPTGFVPGRIYKRKK